MLGSNFSETVLMLHDEPALRHRASYTHSILG
jgi:hypothetical protein